MKPIWLESPVNRSQNEVRRKERLTGQTSKYSMPGASNLSRDATSQARSIQACEI